MTRAVRNLHEYLALKAAEVRDLQAHMSGRLSEFNHRQVAVLEHAVKNADATYTSSSHATSHGITTQTARTDLSGLEDRGYLARSTLRGRQRVWTSAPDLASRLA